ncbi:MAG: hypothetical protein KME10_26950 [Plectolyngbya sp. WJT66-NPBG17]|jgi:hypothetical protein|nr:hypothetical protein [Plectolyngbya sp. WJT66-NPBG17]MBW4528170.1 hypothetical protein [Phormidium tanganyikae FI6-MK23]
MNELISALVGGIIGSISSAVLTYVFTNIQQQHHARVQTTIQMYEKYQSSEMLLARIKAERVLYENRQQLKPLSYTEIYHETYANHDENWLYVSRIVHYFEQIAILHQEKFLEERLFRSSIAPYLRFWYNEYFGIVYDTSIKNKEDTDWCSGMLYLLEYLDSEPAPSPSWSLPRRASKLLNRAIARR